MSELLGTLRDGVAVYEHSDPVLKRALADEREQDRAETHRNGRHLAAVRDNRTNGAAAGEACAVSLTRLSDVKPERVEWLWRNRLPVGKLVTLDGDPGLGKSTLALSVAATVTTAGTWPDSTACGQRSDVLLLSAEDGLADTVRPRLDAAGADVHRVHAIEGITTVDDDGNRVLSPLTLADVTGLEAAITQTAARLLVVDVLMAYLPSGVDSHKDQDVRRVLSRLAGVADKTGCTVLLVRHLNKGAGRDPLYRGGGSIGIVGAARAGLLVAADPDDPERRVLAAVKSNLGPPPRSLSYRLVAADNGVARVEWEGESDHSASELLSDMSDDDRKDRKGAEIWLRQYLEIEGPQAKSREAKKEAQAAGISERTLQRARANLGVVVDCKGMPAVSVWSLPEQVG